MTRSFDEWLSTIRLPDLQELAEYDEPGLPLILSMRISRCNPPPASRFLPNRCPRWDLHQGDPLNW